MTIASTSRILAGASLATELGEAVTVRSWRGEGSYARVYRAFYSRTRGECAVKIAKPEVPDAADRLRREREVLAPVRHSKVVSLLDAGSIHGTPFLVLEWLEGETLLDVVNARRRGLALRQALEVLEAAAEGAAHLHGLGLVHGDIRPQNVLVVPGRPVVLTDPGGLGTPADDVRALGGLLRLMLTGDPGGARPLAPGGGLNPAAVALWERSQAERAPTVSELLAEAGRIRRSL
jgi:hypothetical protein